MKDLYINRTIVAIAFTVSMMVVARPVLAEGDDRLPDSPGTTWSSSASAVDAVAEPEPRQGDRKAAGDLVPIHQRIIQPGQSAQTLTAGDKAIIGFRSAFSLSQFGASLLGAGYGQLTDGRPHYGVDKGAFGERLGSSEAKGITQSLLNRAVLANIFHEDPRYYVMGRQQPFFKRAVYAATRSVITRSDSGHNTVNYANIGGILGANAIATSWYPDRDRTYGRTLGSCATGIGTNALGNEVSEFIGDLLSRFHHKK